MKELADGLTSAFRGSGTPSGNSGAEALVWRRTRRVLPGAQICREPDRGGNEVHVVLSGWLAETMILPDGSRCVFSFSLPGDLIRPSSLGGDRMFLAITNATLGDGGLLQGARDSVWAAKFADTANREEEQLLNQLVRIGRLTAAERVLHLLLELYDRLERVGLAKNNTFRLPITQQMFGETLGLSLVHMNRTLQKLRRSNLITLSRGVVALHDRTKLAAIASYEPYRSEAAAAALGVATTTGSARSWARGAESPVVAAAH